MCRSPDGTYKMYNSSLSLLDIKSKTASMVSSLLAPIEAPENLILTLSSDFRLSVELPWYRLWFRLQEGHLLSENHPGFFVDNARTIGTFIGLQSRLVLAPSSTKLYARKQLIVPSGTIRVGSSGDHVELTVDTEGAHHVSYHEYEIDKTLGQVVDNGDLLSCFTKVYIHAITSFCLPDPLSGLTGTEMAIEELRSPSCLSFQNLQDPEFCMLCKIREVAPWREWYPKHMPDMQTIHWHPHLSFLSQHDDFVLYSSIILQHANTLSDAQSRRWFDATRDDHLQDRAMFCRVCHYAASLQRNPSPEDIQYSCGERTDNVDCDHASESEVARLSTIIRQPKYHVNPVWDLWATFKKWTLLNGTCAVETKYSHKWCRPKWSEVWLPLCFKLQGARTSSLLFTISTAAYTSPGDHQLVQMLLMLATDESLWRCKQPLFAGASVYDLSKGTKPDHTVLQQSILSQAYEYSLLYDVIIGMGAGSLSETRFNATLQSQVNNAICQLFDQWPCENPRDPTPSVGTGWLFDLLQAMREVKGHFALWYCNHALHEHIVEVQRTLDAISVRNPLPQHPALRLNSQAPLRRGRDPCAMSLLALTGERVPPGLPPAPTQISCRPTPVTAFTIPLVDNTDLELR